MAAASPRQRQLATWLLAAAYLVPGSAGLGFDCSQVMDEGVHWNLEKLKGPHSVSWVYDDAPNVANYTFTVDLCQPLKKNKAEDEDHQCPGGTHVCGVKTIHEGDEKPRLEHWVAIAGAFSMSKGTPLEVHPTRLKYSDSHANTEQEGVRLEMLGGHDPFEQKKGQPWKKTKAIVELLCDSQKTGWEPGAEPSEKLGKRETNSENGDGEAGDDGDALKFVSYQTEQVRGDPVEVLRLEWRTKYACEDEASKPSDRSGGWGFFTWFILIVFLGVAAYVVFGSWLNYTRYGARGFDLLPHADTIRDIPYIFKDAMRRFQGGGSRGGYSAV